MGIPLLAVGGSWGGNYWIEVRDKSKQVDEQIIQNDRI
jgi:hypothetical protein